MNTEPKTAEELLACDELRLVGCDEIVCDTLELCNEWGVELGHVIHVPKMEVAEVTPISDDSLMIVSDEKGRLWRPILKQGVWYKQEWML